MTEVAVVNASPLIFLARSGHIDLLAQFYKQVYVPLQVAEEILARGMSDTTARIVKNTEWLKVREVGSIPSAVSAWGLGSGESAVLTLALEIKTSEAVVDDLAGRRCAIALGLPVRGTLGLVLQAKRRNMIKAGRPVLEDLIRGGMYLSRRVLDEALSRVNE